MFVKELDNVTSFLIEDATNLCEKNEIRLFHNLLCDTIVMCNDISKIKDMFLSVLDKKLPYCLVNFDKLNYIIRVYLYD